MTQSPILLESEEIAATRDAALRIGAGLNAALLGQEELTHLVLVALLARGHVLLEGLPGLGKTELVKSLAALSGLDHRRLQFTPDLLPSDVTGGPLLEESPTGGRTLVFHPGPVFTQVLLADEINRASPKTQSALLESMQERAVTVLGETRPLPSPFFVLATQNPVELEGTYPLPEAQLDRFLFKLDVTNPGSDVLARILTTRRHGTPPAAEAVTDAESLARIFSVVDRVFLPDAVAGYIARLVDATHPTSEAATDHVKRYVRFGASPRAAIACAEASRAHALLTGKPNVGFDDVRAVFAPALTHRVILDYRAKLDAVTARSIVEEVLERVGELRQPLPREVRQDA